MSTPTKYDPLFWMTNPGITPKGTRKEFIDPDTIPWTDWLMPGTRYKLLYVNLVSGAFTLILQVDPGAQASPHWHVSNVQAYIIEGGFYYDESDQGHAGSYTCETAGEIHTPYSPNGTTMFAMMDGPVAGYTDDGEFALVADARLHYYMARENNATAQTMVVDYATAPTQELQ